MSERILETTYREVHARQMNLLKFKQDYPAVATICFPIINSIQQYENRNRMTIGHLAEKQRELYDAYVMKDAQGQYIFEEQKRAWDKPEPAFLSAEACKEFNDKWEELMNTSCKIQL